MAKSKAFDPEGKGAANIKSAVAIAADPEARASAYGTPSHLSESALQANAAAERQGSAAPTPVATPVKSSPRPAPMSSASSIRHAPLNAGIYGNFSSGVFHPTK